MDDDSADGRGRAEAQRADEVKDIRDQAVALSRPAPFRDAMACFFLATSKATKGSLYFPMVRPPCMRLGSACPSNRRSYLHERAAHRRRPANMTSSVADRAPSLRARAGVAKLNTRRSTKDPLSGVNLARAPCPFPPTPSWRARSWRDASDPCHEARSEPW
jgi:hypothetical protein